jgi:hypothetical protein
LAQKVFMAFAPPFWPPLARAILLRSKNKRVRRGQPDAAKRKCLRLFSLAGKMPGIVRNGGLME